MVPNFLSEFLTVAAIGKMLFQRNAIRMEVFAPNFLSEFLMVTVIDKMSFLANVISTAVLAPNFLNEFCGQLVDKMSFQKMPLKWKCWHQIS